MSAFVVALFYGPPRPIWSHCNLFCWWWWWWWRWCHIYSYIRWEQLCCGQETRTPENTNRAFVSRSWCCDCNCDCDRCPPPMVQVLASTCVIFEKAPSSSMLQHVYQRKHQIIGTRKEKDKTKGCQTHAQQNKAQNSENVPCPVGGMNQLRDRSSMMDSWIDSWRQKQTSYLLFGRNPRGPPGQSSGATPLFCPIGFWHD